MAMRDEHFGAAPTLTESDGGLWSLPMAAPASEPHDWQCLYEQAQARAETERADAAEARVQELLNDIRRLRTSLRQAEVGKSARGPVPRNTLGAHEVTTGQPLRALDCSQERRDEIAALRRKVAARRRLKRPAQALRPGASARLRKALERARKQKDTIKALRGDVASLSLEARRLNREARRLRREHERLQDLKATVRWLTIETKLQRGALAGYYDQMDVIAGLRTRVLNLEIALRESTTKEGVKGALNGRPLVSAPLGRVRDRDTTIEALRTQRARLQARIAQLHSSGRSCRRRSSGPERAAGDAALEETEERQEPPPAAPICSCCSKPYVANGERSSSVIEIAVKAHIRRIVRPRYRRGCDYPSSPLEAVAPPPARLFARTPFGIGQAE